MSTTKRRPHVTAIARLAILPEGGQSCDQCQLSPFTFIARHSRDQYLFLCGFCVSTYGRLCQGCGVNATLKATADLCTVCEALQ